MSVSEYEELFNTYMNLDDRFFNLINLDTMFASSPDAIILNHIPSSAPDYVKRRNALVFARPGILSFTTHHCDCGDLAGSLNEGRKCSNCGTICRSNFSSQEELEHNAWLGMPKSIPGVLHPIAYIVLTKWLSRKGSVNYIDAIIDPSLELPVELQDVVRGRGHEYFYQNFDALMSFFLHHFKFVDRRSKTKRDNVAFIEQFITCYRSAMFCTKLPVMSSILNSITSSDGTTEGRQYADRDLQIILDAISDLQQVEETTMRTRPNAVPSIIHRIYKSYITYITDIARNRLSRKESLVRKHILGTRMHFSVRAVIIPHMDRYDELYFPWSVSVNVLKLHIIGRLVRQYNMTIGEAMIRQIVALMTFDELIDKIMVDLINECKPEFPGLPVLFVRNPALKRGSMQLLFCSRIKKTVTDKTINISTLILAAPNAIYV